MPGRYSGDLPPQVSYPTPRYAHQREEAETEVAADPSSAVMESDLASEQPEHSTPDPMVPTPPDPSEGAEGQQVEGPEGQDTRAVYESMTLVELRDEARSRPQLTGWSQLAKADLIDMLVEDDDSG